jgi:predicted dehydrogenase
MHRRRFLASTAAGLAALGAAPPPPRVRLALLGTSHAHAAGKLAAVRAQPELYEVVGAAEPDAARQAAAARLPAFAGLAWKSEAELLATPGLHAVLVEHELDAACAAAHRALRAGLHVHLDKPGAASHAAFRAMREEAAARGRTVQLGYMLRSNPAFTLLFRAVRAGWLGEITEIDAAMGKLAGEAQRRALAAYPGGGMFELACHLVDAVLTLLGPPAAVQALAKATRADGFADHQLAVLEYPRATVTLRCNHADPFGGPRRRFAVAGTQGSCEIAPLESGRVTLRLAKAQEGYAQGEHTLALPVPADRYGGEFRDFALAVTGQKPLAWDAAHDIAVHATALRAAGLTPD